MAKYATTYKKKKPIASAKESIKAKCTNLLYADTFDPITLRKFMMTYMYCGFNVVPEEKRYHNMRMSIEDLCMYVGGLLAISMHDVLTDVCNIVTADKVESDTLISILRDAMLYEVNVLLGLESMHSTIYKALVRTLLLKDGVHCEIYDSTPLEEVEELFRKEYDKLEVPYG